MGIPNYPYLTGSYTVLGIILDYVILMSLGRSSYVINKH